MMALGWDSATKATKRLRTASKFLASFCYFRSAVGAPANFGQQMLDVGSSRAWYERG